MGAFSAVLNPLFFAACSDFAVFAFRVVFRKPAATKTGLNVHQPIFAAGHEAFVSFATRAISTTEPNKPF